MTHRRPRLLPTLLAAALACALPVASAQPAQAAQDIQASVPLSTQAWPGTLQLEVDATDLAHRIYRGTLRIPVQPGPMTLWYPEWLPGKHAGYGALDKLAGLVLTGNGKRIDWVRDPGDVYAFKLVVPEGVSTLEARYEFLSASGGAQGRVVMAPEMLNLQWDMVGLYPAGPAARAITVQPTLRLPPGWQAATALEVASRSGDTIVYKPVDFDTLIDSPVYAGRHARVIDLDPGASIPVRLNVFADEAPMLEAKPAHVEKHRALVDQAVKLFGSRPFDHYDFLLSLSTQMAGNGLEHHRSSENGLDTDYFTGWDEKKAGDDLLGHEFVHSWNGKYRRPAELATPHFNTPMRDSLLWVYEGQTQFWGNVLTGRAGLRSPEQSRDALALVAAAYADNRPGLQWRALQDTTHDPIIAMRRPKSYRNYQLSEDYYSGGQMVWLEADARIRAKTGGRKSLDDFARAFFGGTDGDWQVRPYTFDDVVATLQGVVADDWAGFLRDRLDGRVPLTGGIEASGWKLVYRDAPNALAKSSGGGGGDFLYSLGFNVGKDGKVGEVRWDSVAFRAGIGPGMSLVAVDGREYAKEKLENAVKAAKTGQQPIVLLVKDFDRIREVRLDYHGGLRYPHLERIAGKPDTLTALYAPRR